MRLRKKRWRVRVGYETWRKLRRIQEVVKADSLGEVVEICAKYALMGITAVPMRPKTQVIVDVPAGFEEEIKKYAEERGISYARAIDDLCSMFYLFLKDMGENV